MCEATRNVLAAQSEIGAQLRNGNHPAIKVLAAKAGWHVNRFGGYFPADPTATPVQLPIGALYTLIERRVLPDELLSLLTPDGTGIVRIPALVDHDEIARICAEIVSLKTAAHHPESPGGVEVVESEVEGIAAKVVELREAS